MNNYILVTGAAGFIGSHLCERLIQKGEKVIGIDNFDPFYSRSIKEGNLSSIQKKVKEKDQFLFFELSINDKNRILSAIENLNVDMVIHLAAKAGVRPSIEDPQAYTSTNINGTIAILEICREKNIKYHLFASSSSVYGNNKKVPFAEDDSVDFPISPYAATKKSCELLCHSYAHLYNINTACLRFFTVYGPRQRPDLAIHKFTRLIHRNQPITMYGDGQTKRDYTYIDDIIDGIEKTMGWIQQPGTNRFKYEIFNLGESHTIRLKDLISLIESSMNKNAVIQKAPMQPGDVNVTFADITKSKKILGYDPQTKIEKGIPQFIEWFKATNRNL